MASNSEEISGLDEPNIEFTLEETYDQLLEERNACRLKLEQLCEHLRNNGIKAIGDGPNVRELILQERIKFVQCLDKLMKKKQPSDLPVLSTHEAITASVKYLEDRVNAARQLEVKLDKEIEAEKAEIKKLEIMKENFSTMEKIHLAEEEKEVSDSLQTELKNVKKVFDDTKEDLANVTEKLFSDNNIFHDFFMKLCANYFTGGDDAYVEVDHQCVGVIDFLVECDLINYHPYDKKRVKLMNLL